MSFYGRHLGVTALTAGRSASATLQHPAAALIQSAVPLPTLPPRPPSPPAHLTAQTATLEQIAAAFEWYGLTVRPPGGYADPDTLVKIENHVSDLLNLTPSSTKVAAQQQALTDAQTALQAAQANFATFASSPGTDEFNSAVASLSAAQGAVNAAQSTLGGYQSAQIGNQNTVINLALAHSSRIMVALQASGDIPPPPPVQPASASVPMTASSQAGATAGPAPESFMDQYGMLVIAGGAAVVMIGLGAALLKTPKSKKLAGYRRRRSKR